MGLRKRDFSATVGCESGEADPVNHGENLLLRSSAPTFSRVGSLQDPDADDPHDSLTVRMNGMGVRWIRISNLGLWEGLKRSNRGSSNGRIYDFVVGRGRICLQIYPCRLQRVYDQ